MPSNRRIKIFGLLIFLSVVTFFFYTGSARKSPTLNTRTASDFYSKTVNALNNDGNTGEGGGRTGGGAQVKLGAETERIVKDIMGDDDEDDMGRRERLKEAAKVAKGNANAKAPKPDPPSSVIGKGSAAEGSVAGRKTFPLKEGVEGGAQKPVEEKVETPEEHEIEVELNSILKKSPIIIFSKSYCPYSKRAKSILLEKYIIDPAPYVVELDLHPLGLQLQASLADMTGRRTVPNVLINGKTIGGGDEVSGLDTQGTLIETVKSMGGKRMAKVEKRAVEAEKGSTKEKEKKEAADQHDSGLKKRRKLIRKDSIV